MNQDGHSDVGRLERRAYPADYRAERGEEIIGTLLEATPPGRDWPPSREAVSLVAAGLHARRAANLRQGLAASLRQTAVVGAAVYLAQLPSMAIGQPVNHRNTAVFVTSWHKRKPMPRASSSRQGADTHIAGRRDSAPDPILGYGR